jgi:hypothetical protein
METCSSRKGLLPLIILIGFTSALAALGAEPNPGQSIAATYASDGVGVNSRLVVFPSDGSEFTVPLPLTLRYLAYGGSGQSLYATAFKRVDAKSFTDIPGLFRIELNPVRVSPVPGLDSFAYIQRLAVSRSEDKIVFAGTSTDGGRETCGLFELRNCL